MKVFLFVLAATIFEASGDAVIRFSLQTSSLAERILFFALGSVLLALYGTSLNLAPVDFAGVTGLIHSNSRHLLPGRQLSVLPYTPDAVCGGRQLSHSRWRLSYLLLEVGVEVAP